MIVFSPGLPQCRKTLAGRAFEGKPTEPIIGTRAHEWNRFSIFICNEISVATAWTIA
jgi:hypothetical protein